MEGLEFIKSEAKLAILVVSPGVDHVVVHKGQSVLAAAGYQAYFCVY